MFLGRQQNECSHSPRGARSFVAIWQPITPEISGFVMSNIRPRRAPEEESSPTRIE